jgi:hypothetical protein
LVGGEKKKRHGTEYLKVTSTASLDVHKCEGWGGT